MKLNLGCGKHPLAGWVNLDKARGHKVDIECDLEILDPNHIVRMRHPLWPHEYPPSRDSCTRIPKPPSMLSLWHGLHIRPEDERAQWWLPDDTVSELRADHLIEHIRNVLPMMQELWRVAKPNAKFTLTCPYGSSDDAEENPTHVRRMFLWSWIAFSAPYYWREDYGYFGDWRPETVALKLNRPVMEHLLGSDFCERLQNGAGSREDCQRALLSVHTYRNAVLEMEAVLRAVKPAREAKRELLTYPEVCLQMAEVA